MGCRGQPKRRTARGKLSPMQFGTTSKVYKVRRLQRVHFSCFFRGKVAIKYPTNHPFLNFLGLEAFPVRLQPAQHHQGHLHQLQVRFQSLQARHQSYSLPYVNFRLYRNVAALLERQQIKDVEVFTLEDNIDHNIRRFSELWGYLRKGSLEPSEFKLW